MDSGIQFVDNKGNEVSFDELIRVFWEAEIVIWFGYK